MRGFGTAGRNSLLAVFLEVVSQSVHERAGQAVTRALGLAAWVAGFAGLELGWSKLLSLGLFVRHGLILRLSR